MDWLQNLRLQNIFGDPNAIRGLPPGVTPPFNPDAPSPFGNQTITPEIRPFGQPKPMFETPNIELPQPAPMQASPQPVQSGPMMSDISRRMSQYYTPDDDMEKRMEAMLNEFPEREKPGWLRRIGAAIVTSQHGLPAGQAFFDKPYNQKLKAWQDKFEPTYKAAGLERQGNVNERTLAYQTISAELKEEAERNRAENNEEKRKIAQQRANVYDFKSRPENQTKRIVSPKGGFVTAISGDGKAEIVRDSMGQPIPTGTLTEEDLQNLQHENRSAEIAQRGDIRDAQIERQGEITSEHITERGEQSRATKRVTTREGRAELPTQTRVRLFNAAKQLANTKPQWKKWIKFGNPGTNDFDVTPPGVNFWGSPTGPTQQEYDEINNFIYGAAQMVPSHDTTTTTETTTPNSPTPTTGSAPPPVAQRKKGMRHTFANGNIGEWDGTKWVPIKVVTK